MIFFFSYGRFEKGVYQIKLKLYMFFFIIRNRLKRKAKK